MVCFLTVSVFFVVLFSIIPVFADTGSVTIVSGGTYRIDYISTGVKILDAQADSSLGEIIFDIQVLQNNGMLQITLPRQLIDSKSANGTDSDFLIVVDGVLTKPQQIYTSTARILQFTYLTTDEKEIDVIGTYLASSATVPPVVSTPLSQTPSTPSAQNQTLANPTPPPVSVPTPTQAPTPTAPSPTPNVTQTKNFIQKNFDIFVSKIPHLSSVLTRLNMIDYGVIGSIALVVVIVIASAARRKSSKLVHKR